MADTNDLIAFAQGANGDRADRGIKPRHIPAAGENTDHAFLGAHATALSFSSSMQKENRRKRLDVQEASLRVRGKFRPVSVRTRSRIQRDGQVAEGRGAELGKRSINTARGGSAEWTVNA